MRGMATPGAQLAPRRRVFWRAAALLVGSLGLSEPAAAQTPSVRVAAGAASIDSANPEERRLAKAMAIFGHVMPPGRFDQILEAMRPEMERAMREEAARIGRELAPDAAARLFAIMREEMSATMDRAGERIAPVYAQAFTEPELDALLSLYGSPEGRSALAKIPRIFALASAAMREDLDAMNQRVMARMQAAINPGMAPQIPPVSRGVAPGGAAPLPSGAPQ